MLTRGKVPSKFRTFTLLLSSYTTLQQPTPNLMLETDNLNFPIFNSVLCPFAFDFPVSYGWAFPEMIDGPYSLSLALNETTGIQEYSTTACFLGSSSTYFPFESVVGVLVTSSITREDAGAKWSFGGRKKERKVAESQRLFNLVKGRGQESPNITLCRYLFLCGGVMFFTRTHWSWLVMVGKTTKN